MARDGFLQLIPSKGLETWDEDLGDLASYVGYGDGLVACGFGSNENESKRDLLGLTGVLDFVLPLYCSESELGLFSICARTV